MLSNTKFVIIICIVTFFVAWISVNQLFFKFTPQKFYHTAEGFINIVNFCLALLASVAMYNILKNGKVYTNSKDAVNLLILMAYIIAVGAVCYVIWLICWKLGNGAIGGTLASLAGFLAMLGYGYLYTEYISPFLYRKLGPDSDE